MKNKKMIIKSLLLIAGCLLAVNFMAAAVKAEIPEMINIQGVLTQGGQPVTGEVTLVFRFFEISKTPKPIISTPSITKKAAIAVVDPDEAGFFNVAITPEGINFTTPYEVEIAIQGQDPFQPRQPLLSVPYAYTAKNGEKGFTIWGEAAFKAVNVATVDPGAGKMLFDNGSKKMMYHDGTQWIQIDPAYTTKDIKISDIAESTPPHQNDASGTITIPEMDSASGIIITGISGWLISSGTGTPKNKFKITLTGPGGNSVDFFEYLYSTDHNNAFIPRKDIKNNLAIPAKMSGGTSLQYNIHVYSATGNWQYGLMVYYIPLPL